MSGPEHYALAEVLLANLRDEMAGFPGTPLRTTDSQSRMIAEAQAHATLALAAATLVGSEAGYTSHRIEQWAPALGSAHPQKTPTALDLVDGPRS